MIEMRHVTKHFTRRGGERDVYAAHSSARADRCNSALAELAQTQRNTISQNASDKPVTQRDKPVTQTQS